MKPLVSLLTGVLLVLVPLAASAQERPARWQRRDEPTGAPVTVFHSTQSANLPTAETLRGGEWLFEISHRFEPAISRGADALWGLDGPVRNRLGLSYAVTDRLMVGVLRSNLDDNLDLNAKVRVFEAGREATPFMVALAAGVALNTQTPEGAGYEEDETQAWAQLVVNALVAGRLALGAVPTLLHNPRIADVEAEDAFVLGLHGQVYLSEMVSVFGEWILAEEREELDRDAGTIGVELETGGHFFKLMVTNSTRMNPAQTLGGTPFRFEPDEWRLGFNITRLLSF